jgi:hypothetical protein
MKEVFKIISLALIFVTTTSIKLTKQDTEFQNMVLKIL